MLRIVPPPPSPGAHPMAGGTPAMGALRVLGWWGRWAWAEACGAGVARNFVVQQERAWVGKALTAPWIRLITRRVGLLGCAGALLLTGCAAVRDAPRLLYLCPNELRFEARLYEDMALLEGLRGHAVLERLAADDGALRYADVTVRAEFGLGVDGRLVRLDYTNIPEPVYCERAATEGDAGAQVRAHARPGPRPPPPFDPDAPVRTNIRTGDGNNGPG